MSQTFRPFVSRCAENHLAENPAPAKRILAQVVIETGCQQTIQNLNLLILVDIYRVDPS